MHSPQGYYDKVKDLISREDFNRILSDLDEEFDGLISRDVLEYLIVDEMGRNKSYITPISKIRPGRDYTLFGRVMDISRRRERPSIIISDNTLSCILNLYDRNSRIIDEISIGDRIKAVNCHSIIGRDGIVLYADRWSHIEINPEDAPSIEIEPIMGRILQRKDIKVMFDEDGDVRFSRDLLIEWKRSVCLVRVWDDRVKIVERMREGDRIIIYDPIRFKIDGKTLIEVRGISRIAKS
ncbi:MAG: hypothetical protein DRN13_01605 [Thermoplasmata archaeon]|nr:MAG: hypothetical protein DRN13_01605 [Thermoplasmata archaeon]